MIDEKKVVEAINEKIIEVTSDKEKCGVICDFADIVIEIYKEIVCFIENQPREFEWIPCSERLPEVEDLHEISIEDCACYLIQRRFGVMDVAHYIKVYGEPYFEAHCMKFKDVIAWMPLPEPYRPNKCHGCFGAADNDCERCVDGNG